MNFEHIAPLTAAGESEALEFKETTGTRRVGNTTLALSPDEYNRMLFERMHSEQRWENQPAAGWSICRNACFAWPASGEPIKCSFWTIDSSTEMPLRSSRTRNVSCATACRSPPGSKTIASTGSTNRFIHHLRRARRWRTRCAIAIIPLAEVPSAWRSTRTAWRSRLHFGLTPEKLFVPHESRPWNPLIARAFHRRGIIEEWGHGTLKMSDLTSAAGLPMLEIEDDGWCVTVRFRHGQFVPQRRGGKASFSERQDTILVLLSSTEDGLTRREILVRLGPAVSERQVRRALEELQNRGLVVSPGRGKSGRWRRA